MNQMKHIENWNHLDKEVSAKWVEKMYSMIEWKQKQHANVKRTNEYTTQSLQRPQTTTKL